jgi:hypothetical protein
MESLRGSRKKQFNEKDSSQSLAEFKADFPLYTMTIPLVMRINLSTSAGEISSQ